MIWLTTTQMSEHLGIHKQTLLKLRRADRSPFKETRDFRWAGMTTAGRLQWNRDAAELAFTRFKRISPVTCESFAAARESQAYELAGA
jgi:hypothetical protein